ncbi:DUF273 domain-containing protein [Thermodesulfobacteriota bacterium]
MKLAILSLYTEEHAIINEITEPPKKAYAERWGYELINHFGSLDKSRPHPWSKIKLIQQHLAEYDWIFWLDSDATITNQEVRVEQFLNEYDLIIAQECRKCHFNNFQFNTGSFFLRNSQWSHKFLERSYTFTQFMDHPYWDQAAMRHALETDPEACRHVYIESDQRKFNSWAGGYKKGDFVFHAYNFSTAADVKVNLLRKILRQNEAITSDYQADINLFFIINREEETHQLLPEFGLHDMIELSQIEKETNCQLLEATPDQLTSHHYGLGFSTLKTRLRVILKKLEQFPGQFLAFSRPDVQFLNKHWKRTCMVEIEGKQGLFLENGAERDQLGDVLMVLHSTPEVYSFFRNAIEYMEQLEDQNNTELIGSFAQLTHHVFPDSFGCNFSHFPKDNVQNSENPPKGFQLVFSLQIHSAECVDGLEEKRKVLSHIRTSWNNGVTALKKLRHEKN